MSIVTEKINITDMHCTDCSKSIDKVLLSLAGVQKVDIYYIEGYILIDYDPSIVKISSIIKSLEKIGYHVISSKDKKKKLDSIEYRDLIKKRSLQAFLTGLVSLFFFGASYIEGFAYYNESMLTLLIFFQCWVGFSFLKDAWIDIYHRCLGMNTLFAGALLFFYIQIIIAVCLPYIDIYTGKVIPFYVIPLIILFEQLDIFFEVFVRRHVSITMKKLIGSQPLFVKVKASEGMASLGRRGKKGKDWLDCSIEDIMKDDEILIKPGDRIPVDGVVLSGRSVVDESMITGHFQDQIKKKGNHVLQGSLNKTGYLEIKAEKVGYDTALSRVINTIERAQTSASPLQKKIENSICHSVYTAFSLAIMVGLFWVDSWDVGFAFERMSAVLLAFCPCAMSLALLISMIIGIDKAAHCGVLIKDTTVIDKAAQLNTILFDKTGTLTVGDQKVKTVFFVEDIHDIVLEASFPILKDMDMEQFILSIVCSMESLSNHPISKAVVRYCFKQGITPEIIKDYPIDDFSTVLGFGIRGFFRRHKIIVGSQKLIEREDIYMPNDLIKKMMKASQKGLTVSFIGFDKQVIGMFFLKDTIRSDACQTIKEVKDLSIEPLLVSGDNELAAQAAAKKLGIENVLSNVLPQEKQLQVKVMQNSDLVVGMLGDGINDAGALKQADVGIAVGSGSHIAIDTADVVLLYNSLELVPFFIRLSKNIMKNAKQNITFVLIYQLIILLAAMGFFYSYGILLGPVGVSIATSLSCGFVVLNALRMEHCKDKIEQQQNLSECEI